MGEPIAIRLAVASDLDRIEEIEREAATAAHWPRAVYEEIIFVRAAANLTRALFVAERASQIAGFAAARAVLIAQERTPCEVENIAVSSDALRRGVGRALLSRVCNWAHEQGAQELDIEVRASNVGAIALYSAAGFVEVGRRRSYYSAPTEDAILLKLHL